MAMKLQGKRGLVTGGGSGLGKALCVQLARAGVRVVVSDIDADAAQATVRDIIEAQGDADALHLDVTDSEHIQSAVAFLEEQGGLDILVNNAGIASTGDLEDSSEEQWRTIIEVNLLSVVNMTRAFLPLLRSADRACVVNIASAAGIVHMPGMISYNVTKAAVIAFSESLRHELYDSRIRVVCVCPSFFKTNILDATLGMTDEDRRIAEDIMSRARIDADDVAKAAIKGIRRSTFMVATHVESRFAYFIRANFPSLYPRVVAATVRHVDRDAAARGLKGDAEP